MPAALGCAAHHWSIPVISTVTSRALAALSSVRSRLLLVKSSAVALSAVLLAGLLAATVVGAPPASASGTTQSFAFTGSAQSWTVPAGVTSVEVTATGGAGGESGTAYATGGLAGEVTAVVPVTPGEVLQVNVGGKGQDGIRNANAPNALGGWNGGGYSTGGTYGSGGGGGGASDVREGGTALANRVVVAGGGGGGDTDPWLIYNGGGSGGALTGQAGDFTWGGSGGTQTAGGAPGQVPGNGTSGTAGSSGQGGTGNGCVSGSASSAGGGGGGGYWGGGGGSGGCLLQAGGGGGGSSYTETTATGTQSLQGFSSGNGSVTITWPPALPPACAGGPGSQTFPATTPASTDRWTVPAGVTSVLVDAQGAGATSGGRGGRELAIISVTPCSELEVTVGAQLSTGQQAFGGGGSGSVSGGGASDVRAGGVEVTSRQVVAGGGGGSGALASGGSGTGGNAGGPTGTSGTNGTPGSGTAGAGGAGGSGPGWVNENANSVGGSCPGTGGGGGGGIAYGSNPGGGACNAGGGGGGGGSSFPATSATATNVGGVNAGPGTVTITYPVAYGTASLHGGPVLASEKEGNCACSAYQVPVPTVVEPVDPGTGAWSEQATDLVTPGRGRALAYRRSYTSDLAAKDGPMGYGWNEPYNMSLALGTGTPPSTVTVSEETGSKVVFNYSPVSATYAPAVPRDQATLVSSGSTWTYTRRARQIFDFSSSGVLTDEKDLNANTTTIGAVSGGTQTITDPAARSYTLSYDASNHVTAVAEQSGGALAARSVSYAYSADHRYLTSVTDVNGGVTDYGYERLGAPGRDAHPPLPRRRGAAGGPGELCSQCTGPHHGGGL